MGGPMRTSRRDCRGPQALGLVGRLVCLGICVLPFALAPGAADATNVAPAAITSETGMDGLVSRVQARGAATPPSLNVGSVIIAEPASETPLPIQVGPVDGLPKNSFVRIRGLPTNIALSEGHSIATGSWAVPFVALPMLRISVPVGLAGTSDIVVSLVTVDGIVLAEVKTSLVITPASLIASGKSEPQPRNVASIGPSTSGLPSERSQPAQPSAPPQPPRTQAQQQALRFITRGNDQLLEGDVSAARLFFQRAIDAGLPEGALAMASSYDQVELDRLGVKGLTGDRNTARHWYEQARRMGASEAEERLRRLGGR